MNKVAAIGVAGFIVWEVLLKKKSSPDPSGDSTGPPAPQCVGLVGPEFAACQKKYGGGPNSASNGPIVDPIIANHPGLPLPNPTPVDPIHDPTPGTAGDPLHSGSARARTIQPDDPSGGTITGAAGDAGDQAGTVINRLQGAPLHQLQPPDDSDPDTRGNGQRGQDLPLKPIVPKVPRGSQKGFLSITPGGRTPLQFINDAFAAWSRAKTSANRAELEQDLQIYVDDQRDAPWWNPGTTVAELNTALYQDAELVNKIMAAHDPSLQKADALAQQLWRQVRTEIDARAQPQYGRMEQGPVPGKSIIH